MGYGAIPLFDFAQLSWYFRREWRRYLGAIALLVIIAVLQLIPPKVVGIVVDGVTQQHYTCNAVASRRRPQCPPPSAE